MMNLTFTRAVVTLSAAALVFATIAPSSPAVAETGTWSATTDLSTGFAGMYNAAPQVSFADDGNAVAVWSMFDGNNVIVQTRSSSDGGVTWGPLENLSAAGQDAYSPSISIDDAGNAIAIWQHYGGVNAIVQTRSSSDGGATWTNVESLSAAGEDASSPQVSLDDAGNAIAIWQRYDGSNFIVQTRSSSDGGATWTNVESLSAAGQDARNPQVSLDDAGNAIAIWVRYDGTDNTVQTRSSNDGGATWSGTLANVSDAGQSAYSPQVSFDSAGNAIAIWERFDGSTLVVQASSSSDGGDNWSSGENLSVPGQDAGSPQLSCDAAGNTVAIWRRNDVIGNAIIQTRSSSDGGATWGDVVNHSDSGQGTNPQISAYALVNAMAIWSVFDGTNGIIQTRSSSDAGLTWGVIENLSPAGSTAFNPQISVDAAGNAIAIWVLISGSDLSIQSRALTVPALANTGAETSAIGAVTATGMGLLTAGVLALVMVRRRRACAPAA